MQGIHLLQYLDNFMVRDPGDQMFISTEKAAQYVRGPRLTRDAE